MAKVEDCANLLIELTNKDENTDDMTNLRLNKLLYFAQGHYLARYGKPLFDDEVIIMSYPLEEIIFKRAEKEYSENFTSIMNAYLDIIISVYSKKESFLNNYKEEVIKEFQWRMKKYLQRDDIEPNYYEVLLEFLKEYTIDKIERIS